MPKAFEDCVTGGGRVRTKRVNAKQYIRVCWPKGGGKSVSGEVRSYKKVLKGGK